MKCEFIPYNENDNSAPAFSAYEEDAKKSLDVSMNAYLAKSIDTKALYPAHSELL